MFIAGVVLVLFGISYALPTSQFAALLPVSMISAGVAAITLLGSIGLYFWNPQTKTGLNTFFVYVLLVALTASIVLTTGTTSSPLIGLWIVTGVFAGVFGWRGFLFITLLIIGYDIYAFLTNAPIEAIVIGSIASVSPMIASFIIWHTKSDKETAKDKAYNELATELSHEANKSEVVINAINDGVVLVDTSGVIQLINPAAQRIIGWGQNDAVGLSYKSVIKLNDKADKPLTDANDPVAQVLATNQDSHSEDFSVTTESGKKILLSLIVSPIGNPSTGAIMVFRDMTKEKAEEREQAEFISTASHEMRTPVASIEGYLGLALNPAIVQVDEKGRDYIQKAHESAQHLGRLFQDLLDVSKAEDGRLSNNPKVVDVADFVGDVAEGLQPKATEKGLRFLYKPRPETESNIRTVTPVYYAHVDNDHLREVVANLIENAIKYTPAGDVIIDVGGDETHVTISVQDSGIGIPTEDIPHLFQKFYRVDNSDTREIGGTGLGLYLCRRLAEVMGGQIKVESEYKRGSTFSLVLPRIDHLEATRLMEIAETAEEVADTPIIAESNNPMQPTSPALIAPNTPHASAVSQLPQPSAPPVPPQTPVVIAPTPAPLAAPVVTTPQPQPVAQPMPVATPDAVPQPAPTQPVTPQAPNIPLSQLEQNPAAYTSARPSIQIPVRSPGDNKQP